MAPSKKVTQEVPEPSINVQAPISVPSIYGLYLQEVYNRTELERQAVMNRVRTELSVPEGMGYNPQAGVFMFPPAEPQGPELLPDASD